MSAPAPSDQTVVVGVDGSDSALGAALWAADLAARWALPLTLLHAVPRLEWHFSTTPAPPLETNSDVLAAALAEVQSHTPNLAVHAVSVKGSVASALTEASASARLLVVGSGATDHRAVGGHVVRITHRSLSPVAVWRQPAAKRTGKPLPVVVGIDESDDSARALAAAFDVAGALHAPLSVVHMWEIGAAVGLGYSQGLMDWKLLDVLQSQQRRKMDELVAPFLANYGNAHVNKVFQDISPAKGLTELSAEAQLVVVGSHGSGTLADAALGSVSQNLVHHAECPVLVVR
jgi:nucleotide-binding universal stress UspA family protein